MLGYVMINKGDLKVRELETYQSFYCGLCQKLKERYGLSGQLTLSYDLTFVVMLLTGLYEPKVKKGTTHCVIHPLKKQPIQVDVFSDYAADMSILLNYYKCMDDWADEQKIDRRLFAELLKRKFGGLEASYSERASGQAFCGRGGKFVGPRLYGRDFRRDHGGNPGLARG